MMTLQDIQDLGIIGAGGAGFPAHVKLNSRPDTLLMNAAECEPLLHKDMELIRHDPESILKGMLTAMHLTGAKEGIIGIKNKHPEEIRILAALAAPQIRIIEVEDVYPAGDEVTLIYMTTKRIVQPGALPISVGCVVLNVETLLNIGREKPVTEKYISVAGAVDQPATVKVPVGTSYRDILDHFTLSTPDYRIRTGGLMMGVLEDHPDGVVSRRTGAIIVLPSDHYCVSVYERYATEHDTDRLAKAACDQCNFCTELCPRYLLGQPVRPELAMRNRMFTREDEPMVFAGNLSCCECNLCTFYACPEGLDPKGATLIEKRISREQQLTWNGPEAIVHPMYNYRKVPTKKLMQRLDVMMFQDEGPLTDIRIQPKQIRIPLSEHIGSPARAVVSSGQVVSKGDRIGEATAQVSVPVHASVSGIVVEVNKQEIIIQAQ